jgi:hypothetical protein
MPFFIKAIKMTFYEYLNSIRPIINVAALERLADGVPFNALGKHYSWADTGKGYPISQDHSAAIVRAMAEANGGVVKIGSAVVHVEKDKPGLVAVYPGKLKCKEVGPGVLAYVERQQRQHYSEFDFCTYFWGP